jgi:hypothetical protein
MSPAEKLPESVQVCGAELPEGEHVSMVEPTVRAWVPATGDSLTMLYVTEVVAYALIFKDAVQSLAARKLFCPFAVGVAVPLPLGL